jgi:PAS domain-containing protein
MQFFRTLAPIALAIAIAMLLAMLGSVWAALWTLMAASAAFGLYHAVSWPGCTSGLRCRPTGNSLGIGPWASALDRLARASRVSREAKLEMQSELELIHGAVDKLPDGLVVLDRFDHVTWANAAAEELHGIFGRGRPLHHFIRQPEFLEFLASGSFNRSIQLGLPSRPNRIFELRIHETGDHQKLVITRDISDQAKLDVMRRDFVANVSHEIRTPVTVIGGFAETLMTLELDDGSRQTYLSTILRQSQTMQRLVDDLLTLSSLEHFDRATRRGGRRCRRHDPRHGDRGAGLVQRSAHADGRGSVIRAASSRAHRARERHPEPDDQRDPLHARGRIDHADLVGRSHGRLGFRHRHRDRHRRRTHPADHGTFLPRLARPFPGDRRYRTGLGHRQAHRAAAPGPPGHSKRTGQGKHFRRAVPHRANRQHRHYRARRHSVEHGSLAVGKLRAAPGDAGPRGVVMQPGTLRRPSDAEGRHPRPR